MRVSEEAYAAMLAKRTGWTTNVAKTAVTVDTSGGAGGAISPQHSEKPTFTPQRPSAQPSLASRECAERAPSMAKADAGGEASANVCPPDAASSPLYALVLACRAAGLAEPIPEYRFHPLRRWRFDYAFPLHMVAVEIEGAVWTQGRHTRGSGFLADMQKYNEAAKLGWRLLRYSPQTLGAAIDDLRVILA